MSPIDRIWMEVLDKLIQRVDETWPVTVFLQYSNVKDIARDENGERRLVVGVDPIPNLACIEDSESNEGLDQLILETWNECSSFQCDYVCFDELYGLDWR